VVELRQYTLRPGQRDTLVEVFDRALVEPQEAAGMRVLGQFRDLADPDRFVWLRGFADMAGRAAGLQAFYGGPDWAQHGPAANATMLAWDDVLLLRPAWPGAGIPPQPHPPAHATGPGAGLLDLAVFPLGGPAPQALLALAREVLAPCLVQGGALRTAWYVTEPSANNFPRLPVRTGVQVLVGLALFPDAGTFRNFQAAGAWSREAAPALAPFLAGRPEVLQLAPTARSALRA
jgi:hypothetical protein